MSSSHSLETPLQVKTLPTGEIDYDDFQAMLEKNKGRAAIVNVNVGTTVRGAVDDLDRVLAILKETGYSEDKFYIHCDAALFGIMVGLYHIVICRTLCRLTCVECFILCFVSNGIIIMYV
jgi:hypothetical protein